jgi:hypothetical protein
MILFSFKHLSTTDSDNEPSKVPPVTSTTPTKDNQTFNSRPQSPNVEQIAEHNQTPKAPIKKKEQRRSNSAESFNRIPLVDDKSLDSASENNTETEKQKKRQVKSKKKDVETSTDGKNGNY